MNDTVNTEVEDVTTDDLPQESELDSLKARADQLGIQYRSNIGVDKLREKVNAAIAGDTPKEEPTKPKKGGIETASQVRARKKREATKLVRIRLTCMNPAKKDWEGEIFTTGNATVGTVKKMVPFNAEWHVPAMLLKMIQSRQCQIFQTVTDAKGRKVRRGKLIKEFAVEILPDLTKEELKDLAQRQAMANGTAA